jgi:hypothetical protein
MAKNHRRREATIVVDEVPHQLRELIPLAEEWGTWNPQRCDEIIEGKSIAELRPFVQAVEQHRQAIDTWLDSMPKDMEKWPEAAEVFLFLVRNWHEADCDLYARETYNSAEGNPAPDANGD